MELQNEVREREREKEGEREGEREKRVRMFSARSKNRAEKVSSSFSVF